MINIVEFVIVEKKKEELFIILAVVKDQLNMFIRIASWSGLKYPIKRSLLVSFVESPSPFKGCMPRVHRSQSASYKSLMKFGSDSWPVYMSLLNYSLYFAFSFVYYLM